MGKLLLGILAAAAPIAVGRMDTSDTNGFSGESGGLSKTSTASTWRLPGNTPLVDTSNTTTPQRRVECESFIGSRGSRTTFGDWLVCCNPPWICLFQVWRVPSIKFKMPHNLGTWAGHPTSWRRSPPAHGLTNLPCWKHA